MGLDFSFTAWTPFSSKHWWTQAKLMNATVFKSVDKIIRCTTLKKSTGLCKQLSFFANWFCLLIFALCSFWPFKFFHPAWTLFWTALLCMTLKFPRIYYQPYLHSKETIGCSHTKLSHLNGCVTVINDLLSAKEWRKTKLVWRHSISDHTILMLLRTWSRVCFFSFQLKIFEVYLLSNWFVYCACIAVWNRESAIAFNCSEKNMS